MHREPHARSAGTAEPLRSHGNRAMSVLRCLAAATADAATAIVVGNQVRQHERADRVSCATEPYVRYTQSYG